MDPAGVRWNVRRRWYPWRRTTSFRETWSESSGEPADPADAKPGAEEAEDGGLPPNFLLKVILISLAELVLELIVLPFALVLRQLGAARWPVQTNRQGKHFTTRYADDFAAGHGLIHSA